MPPGLFNYTTPISILLTGDEILHPISPLHNRNLLHSVVRLIWRRANLDVHLTVELTRLASAAWEPPLDG